VLQDQEIPALFALKDSLHHLGLMDVLAAAQLLGVAPKTICLIGIQPLAIETGLDLTDTLQARLPLLITRVLAQLEAWGLSLTPRPS
jgi:hydrogenase maturation protease